MQGRCRQWQEGRLQQAALSCRRHPHQANELGPLGSECLWEADLQDPGSCQKGGQKEEPWCWKPVVGSQVTRDASAGSRVVFPPCCCAAELSFLVISNSWSCGTEGHGHSDHGGHCPSPWGHGAALLFSQILLLIYRWLATYPGWFTWKATL